MSGVGYIAPTEWGLSLFTDDGELVASCNPSKKKGLINLSRELENGPYYKGQMNPATQPDRFTDDEIEIFDAGKCGYQTAYGMPWTAYCKEPSVPNADFGYCAEHSDSENCG
jgi:hypothetical protein